MARLGTHSVIERAELVTPRLPGARALFLSKQTRPARGEPVRAGSEPGDGLGNEIGEA